MATNNDRQASAAADWLRQQNAELYALRYMQEQNNRRVAQGLGSVVDAGSFPVRRAANFGANVMRDLTGNPTQEMNLSPARDLVSAAYPLGGMNILPFNVDAPVVPVPAATPPVVVAAPRPTVLVSDDTALPESFLRPVVAAPMSTTVTATQAPAVVPVGAAPVVAAPMAASNASLALDPVQAARVDIQPGGRLNPIKCTSGVCRPTIQVGDFYANSAQSGIARDGGFGASEFDRFGRARFEQNMVGGGRAGVLRAEQAGRLDDVTQLRQTPQYLAEFQAALVNSGGDRAAAQALADQRFLAASTDPNLALGLTENNTAGMIDNLLSRQAAAALESGQAELPNRASSAAAEAGYYGPGILPYGSAPDAPGFLTPGNGLPVALTGYDNVPGTYSAAARAVSGVGTSQARADAAEASIQQLIASGASAASVNALRMAQAQALAVRNDPAVRYAEMVREQELRAAGRGGGSTDLMNLLAPQP